MIRVYTKTRHVETLDKILTSMKLDHEIYTIHNLPKDELKPFVLGISYSYPRKITKPLLDIPTKGFVNYHAAPLPKYKGWKVYQEAIANKETHWGVSVQYMDEHYDTGPIIQVVNIELHEPATNKQQLGAIGHWFMYHLFKRTIRDIYNGNVSAIPQKVDAEEIFVKDL